MTDYVPSIDYTSRDFNAIRADLIDNIQYFAPQWLSRDSSDLGIVLLELFAYMGDIQSFYIDRAANEAFITTATQRASVLSIANLLGYTESPATPAGVTLTFTNTHPTNSIIVPPLLQVSTATIMNSGVTPVIFETFNSTGTTIAPGATASILAYEGHTVANETLTAAFNGLPSQAFKLAEAGADINSIVVYVNSQMYTRVSNLLDYPGTASVYSTLTDSDGYVYIQFGDNVGGRVPQVNATITASYRVISGVAGNVLANTVNYVLSSYTFTDTTDGSGLTVTNPSAASGGADVESTYSIRLNAPRSLRALNRAVTLADYSSLALQVSSVGKVNAASSVFSSVNLYMGLSGASGLDGTGTPTASWTAASSALSTYLADKIPPGTTVTVLPPVMVPVTINVNVNVLSNYKQSSVVSDVTTSITTMLEYLYVDFGQRVTQQQVLMNVGLTAGVDYASITALYGHTDTSGIGDVVCAANEIPYLASITVTATGGIV